MNFGGSDGAGIWIILLYVAFSLGVGWTAAVYEAGVDAAISMWFFLDAY